MSEDSAACLLTGKADAIKDAARKTNDAERRIVNSGPLNAVEALEPAVERMERLALTNVQGRYRAALQSCYSTTVSDDTNNRFAHTHREEKRKRGRRERRLGERNSSQHLIRRRRTAHDVTMVGDIGRSLGDG